MSVASNLVECDSVSRNYGTSVAAVTELRCTVSASMRVALTGPSGSGKSTLLHLMAGLERPSSGTVSWPALDRTPSEGPGTVAVVFQSPSLLPDLDVTENVGLPLLLGGERPAFAAERAAQALSRVGIAELAAKLPEELSGGQAQRVALARALVTRPVLILADEPTGQLDHATGYEVMSVLLAAADELGAALVVATHDPAVAVRLDEQWRMRDGRFLPPGEVSPGDIDVSSTQVEGAGR